MCIESIINRMLVKYPLFGSVVAHSHFVEESSIETVGTDGKTIYYNPLFLASLSKEEQVFVLAHEICHIAFNHIFRSEGREKDLWNIATDAVINAFLKQDGLPLVDGVVAISEAIHYDAEEFYQKLLEEKKQQEKDNRNKEGQKQDSSNNQENSRQQNDENESGYHDVGHDTHAMWEKAIEDKHREEKSSCEKDLMDEEEKQTVEKDSFLSKVKQLFSEQKKKRQAKDESQGEVEKKQEFEKENEREEDIEKWSQWGEKDFFKQNKIERKKQLEELRDALVRQSHGCGDTTNRDIRNITSIGTSAPLLDWRRLLKEAVKYEIDWSYENAGIEDGVVTAYLEEMPQPETEIVLDTSGSINEVLLRNFLRECKNILSSSKVKVGCFDTKFYGFTEIKNEADIDKVQFYGGGGTDFDVAVNAFTRRVENKIIFTDGWANMPSTRIDAIWIVFGDRKINPIGGKVIYINEEQLKKLCHYETKGRAM